MTKPTSLALYISMCAHLRTTERHLKLLSIPFGLKRTSRKGLSTTTTAFYSTRNYDRGNRLFEPRRTGGFIRGSIKVKKVDIRSLTSSATGEIRKETTIKTELLNPEKADPGSIKDLALQPISPQTAPRFKKSIEAVPSVTKILSATMPAASQYILDKWKEAMIKKLGNEGFTKYQQETFERGRILHALVASYLMGQGGPGAIDKDIVANLWNSIEKVVRDNITNVRLVEHVVTHSDMKYRGIVDCVACYKDELVVIDFKTAEKPKKSVASLYDNPLQVTAYCGAINNDKNIPTSVIDRNICAGLVIVAYIDGSEASVYYLGRDKVINDYWKQWTARLGQFSQMEALRNEQKNTS